MDAAVTHNRRRRENRETITKRKIRSFNQKEERSWENRKHRNTLL
jgi:hypothetical protein